MVSQILLDHSGEQCLTVVLMDGGSPRNLPERVRRSQGSRIRSQREFLTLSQSQLAELVGVTKSAVSGWERGETTPRPAHQIRIAEALRTPWGNLFGLEGVQ